MMDPAIDGLRAALAVAPEDGAIRRMLADRLLERGRFDEAIEEYRALVRLTPADPSPRLGLIHAYLGAGHPAPAEIVADELLAADPTHAVAHLLRARALLAQSRADDAAAAYSRAVRIDPSVANEALAIQVGFAARPGPAERPDGPDEDSARTESGLRRETSERPAGPPMPRPHDREMPAAESQPRSRPEEPEDDEDEDEEGHVRVSRRGGREDREPDRGRRPEEARLPEPDGMERPTISFADVGGMEALKEEIRLKIIYPRQHPELYRAYGKTAGGGILLYGPPGCGKTHLARATAGELGASFASVGIADVLNMYIGESERNLHRIFTVARQHAPCVLFFDEVDALAASRADFKSTAGRALINQFLSELDGADASNEGVLVIGATNAPWHMDSAFRRPGRFDNIVFVPPPDAPARAAILDVLLRDRPARDVDRRRIAGLTEGYSGADLQGIVERAIEAKLAEALRAGVPKPLTTDDVSRAIRSVAPTTREWFATVRNYVLYANESGLYDPVRPYLKGR